MSNRRKRPWNRTNVPVYSIATEHRGVCNMNICTYATPVSMKPKRYIVALYKGTFTETLARQSTEFVLQMLSEKQISLVPILGKKSGRNFDKLKKIKDKQKFGRFTLLGGLSAFIHLRTCQWIDGGDHWCILCEVVTFKNVSDEKLLTLDHLREKKIISV